MAEHNESKQRLLEDCEEQSGSVGTSLDYGRAIWARLRLLWWLCQAMVFSANLILLTNLITYHAAPVSLRRPYELVEAPIEAETVSWDASLGQNSTFTSMNPKIADAAWAEIQVTESQGYVYLSKDQLKQLGKYSPSSVRAKDGSGYLGLVGVFHQLHCLNYLRRTNVLYADNYPNTLQHPTVPIELHIPHCLDLLRLALQCYGELTTSTHNWVDGWIEPWEDWKTQHQCRNFNAIRDWAKRNNGQTSGAFVHPELGPVLHSKINVSALPVGRKVRYVDDNYDD